MQKASFKFVLKTSEGSQFRPFGRLLMSANSAIRTECDFKTSSSYNMSKIIDGFGNENYTS